MQYVIVIVDEPEVTCEVTPPEQIIVDFSQVIQSTGGGGSANSRVFDFNQSDLNPDGSISFLHNLGLTLVDYSVISPDFGEVEVVSDSYELNRLTINLSSFMPINGLWRILIEV